MIQEREREREIKILLNAPDMTGEKKCITPDIPSSLFLLTAPTPASPNTPLTDPRLTHASAQIASHTPHLSPLTATTLHRQSPLAAVHDFHTPAGELNYVAA